MLRQQGLRTLRQARPMLRQQVQQAQQQVRRAGGHAIPNITHNVKEPLGATFWVAFATFPALCILYKVSRPGPNGEMPWLTRLIFDYQVEMRDEWLNRNVARTQAIEQAAHDRHLFSYAPRQRGYELRYPEAIYSGCPWNVPAGHNVNLDKLTEHYRQQYMAGEDRKLNKLRAKGEFTDA